MDERTKHLEKYNFTDCMTVKELIEELSKYPPEMLIIIPIKKITKKRMNDNFR